MNFLANSAGMAIGRAAFAIMSAHVSPENIAAFARGSGSNRTLKHERDSSLAEIQEHRAKIDEIDKQIVALLNKRAGHSLVIRGLKPGAHLGLYDAKREEEIFAKVSSYNEGPLYNENLCEIYATILKIMKETPSV